MSDILGDCSAISPINFLSEKSRLSKSIPLWDLIVLSEKRIQEMFKALLQNIE